MKRTYTKWWSPSLGKDMELLEFGDSGTPVLVFPTSLNRFFEWEDKGMIDALSFQITHGHNRIFLVDSVDHESFYNKTATPDIRILRYYQYERYIIDEVVPHIKRVSDKNFIISTGCSFGAYHALNMAFRNPRIFGKLIAMGGKFDIRPFFEGYFDNQVYFQNPAEYMPNLNDQAIINEIAAMDIRLVTGQHDMCWDANEKMSMTLKTKGIKHTLDVWADGTGHDWPWWKNMIVKHIA